MPQPGYLPSDKVWAVKGQNASNFCHIAYHSVTSPTSMKSNGEGGDVQHMWSHEERVFFLEILSSSFSQVSLIHSGAAMSLLPSTSIQPMWR